MHKGFAVIDVNVPKHISSQGVRKPGYQAMINFQQDDLDFVEGDPRKSASGGDAQTCNLSLAELHRVSHDLPRYCHADHRSTSQHTHLLLLGIGDAYAGIMGMLSEHRKYRDKFETC